MALHTVKVLNGVTVETIDNGHTLTVRRTGTLPCGCEPHTTQMTPMGYRCVTEDQGYCNFECPHDEDVVPSAEPGALVLVRG